jgi:glycosyltransferase involved in cell wall biosynthesis
MNKYDLSLVIPARNEEWLSETIEDILKNKRGKTEIIAILDGEPPMKPIADHEDLTLIFLPESIGQRAAQNLGVKLSKAKYVSKVDSHCAFDEGFDVKLMDKMEDDMTMVPVMRNLHIFNWRCKNCGLEIYQGPEPKECNNEICPKASGETDGGEGHKAGFEKNVVWIPKRSPQSSAYRFNKNLRFKYFPELRNKLSREGLQETMSLQGSFFMCTREKYWSLGLCDESWGSWGMQGSEVALKTWLSGGRVLCNFDTWYAHLFRTQSGFSFPYPQSGRGQHDAIKICQDLFYTNSWDKQKYKLGWLLKKFWFALKEVQDPEARWEESDLDKYE